MLLKIKYDTGGHFLHLQVVIFVFLTKLSSIFFLCTNCNLKKKTTYRCFANLMHFGNFLRGECLDKYSVNPFEDPEKN